MRIRKRPALLLVASIWLGSAVPALATDPPSLTATCTVLESGRALLTGTIDGLDPSEGDLYVLDGSLYPNSPVVGHLAPVADGDFEVTTFEGYTATPGTTLQVEIRHVSGFTLAITPAVCVALVRSVTDLTNELAASGVLSQGEANSLLVKVDNSTASATKGNVEAAVRQLEAFKNEIEALYQSARITLAERDAIVASADRQIAELTAGA